MKFILFEVWTTWRHVEAECMEDAYRKHQPALRPNDELNLSNWHIVPADEPKKTVRKK